MWKRVVVGVLVCAVCVLCLGAEVQEPTKQDREPTKGDGRLAISPSSWEYWDVKEVRHWTSSDGQKVNQIWYYTLEVSLGPFGEAFEFRAYVGGEVLWTAYPPEYRYWNDSSATKPCATFGTDSVVGFLKINRNWVKATGKITQCAPDAVYPNVSWYCEGTVNAVYDYTDYP